MTCAPKILLAAAAALSACAVAASAAPPTTIGIVEETTQGDWGSPVRAEVRLGFVETEEGWAAIECRSSPSSRDAKSVSMTCKNFTNPNEPMNWSVEFRGKKLGEITTKNWFDTKMYSHAGSLRIISGKVPFFGKRNKNFSGWMDAAVHHPLIAVIPGMPPAAYRWVEDKQHPELLDLVWPTFLKLIPDVDVCHAVKGADPSGTTRATQRTDLVALRGWRSASGEMLLHVAIKLELSSDCDGPSDKQTELWFYRDTNGKLRALPGQFADPNSVNPSTGMMLVDIGAFAGDDREQAIFFIGGYNMDGYILYYDHFRKFAIVTWGYH